MIPSGAICGVQLSIQWWGEDTRMSAIIAIMWGELWCGWCWHHRSPSPPPRCVTLDLGWITKGLLMSCSHCPVYSPLMNKTIQHIWQWRVITGACLPQRLCCNNYFEEEGGEGGGNQDDSYPCSLLSLSRPPLPISLLYSTLGLPNGLPPYSGLRMHPQESCRVPSAGE